MRYLTEIGLKRQPSEYTGLAALYASQDRTGILRRYHSTITAAMLESKYGEHNAAVTAMLTAQANNGHITSVGQYRIAELESLWKAAKSGKILQNDAIVIKGWKRIIDSLSDNATPGNRFEDIFTDATLELYSNVNGMPLHGYRKGYKEDGEAYWYKIDRNDPNITTEDKRNWLKYAIMPEVLQKLIGSMNRRPSPTVLDSQKPDGTLAFYDLIESAANVCGRSIDLDAPFEERFKPKNGNDILDAKDPNSIQRKLNEARNEVYERFGYQTTSGPQTSSSQRQNNREGVPMGNHKKTYFDDENEQRKYEAYVEMAQAFQKFNQAVERSNETDDYLEKVNDPESIRELIDNIFATHGAAGIEALGGEIMNAFYSNETLAPHARAAGDIVYNWIDAYTANSQGTTDLSHNLEQSYINSMQTEINDLLDSIDYR